jgi:hypothetical protein
MSLYVIDDHPLMREAVVMLLRRCAAAPMWSNWTAWAAWNQPSRPTARPN